MQLRKAIQEIAMSTYAENRDQKTAAILSKRDNWTRLQQKECENLARKYKKHLQNFQEKKARRATMRSNWIYLFHDIKGEEYKELLKIPGREIEPEFRIPCNLYSIRILKEMNFVLSENIKEWEKENQIKVSGAQELPPGLELYPYQKEGVKRIHELNGRCLLADQMGVGKSAQVAAYIAMNPQLTPVLLICPSGLKLNWQKELRMWGVKQKITIINSGKDELPEEGVIIMSYNMTFKFFAQVDDINVQLLVCDESHALIHATSQRTKAVRYLARAIDRTILISGTPLTSRPANLFVQLNILDAGMFGSREKFLNRYCGALRDPSGKGCTNSDELHDILTKSFMIRRLKKDVLKDLPPKVYSVIPMEMSREYRKEYEFAKNEIVSYIKQNYGDQAARRAMFGEVMVRMEHLKQIAVRSKLQDSLEYIKNVIDSGEKVVVFGTHKFVIQEIMDHFGNIALKIDGSLSTKKKQENVDKFQNDEKYKIMVANIQAGGVGITLTASSNVVFLQFPWTPGELTQAIDRCHRIGATAECINVHYLVANNTIEEDICSILDRKTKVLNDILDGGEMEEGVLLNELIQKFRRM